MNSITQTGRRWAFIGVCLTALGMTFGVGRASAREAVVVALGDSNTAGFGVGVGQAFPTQLDAMLQSRGRDVRVGNAGVTGDTFGGMLARLDSSVPPGTRLVIVQGGYNDVLRGTPPEAIVASIDGILTRLDARKVKAVLCGFFYPDWDAVGRRLAARHRAIFVSGSTCYDPNYRGPDGLHMGPAGHQVVAGRLAPVVENALFASRSANRRAPNRGVQAALRPRFRQ